MVTKESDRLLRLVRLYALFNTNRIPTLNRVAERKFAALNGIWKKYYTSAPLLPEFLKGCITTEIREKIGEDALAIFLSEFDLATTLPQIQKCIRRFFNDSQSIMCAPLKKSTRGNKGPTFLISYARPSQKLEEPIHHAYVVKWVQRSEFCCNRILQDFSKYLEQENKLSFLAPQASLLDPFRGIHERADGSLHDFSEETAKKVMGTFQKIAKITCPNHPMSDPLIMLSERINGENLLDFALTKYEFLSEKERIELLENIGKIALIDILLGNIDRFIQIWFNPKRQAYQLIVGEANLGNCMILWSTDPHSSPPLLYAIDNGIDSHLIDDSQHKQDYLYFLQELFTHPEMESILSDNITICFQQALTTQIDDISGANVTELKQKLKAFKKDIQDRGHECFQRGLNQMSSQLRELLVPRINSDTTLNEYLLNNYPEILNSIQERFNLFIILTEEKS